MTTTTPTTAPVRAEGLSPAERAVLEALTTKPQAAKQIARAAGYSLRTVQNALTSLCRRVPPLAHRSADGYTRA